jgi:hypothetical protein
VPKSDLARDISGQDVPAKIVLKAYRQMLVSLFLGASAVIGFLVVLILVPYLHMLFHDPAALPPAPQLVKGAQPSDQAVPAFPIFVLVVISGTVGAFFSALQRLYEMKGLPQILYNEQLSNEYGTLFVYSLIPALVGGIAAAVLYLMFAGQMLSGAFFPEFACKQDPCDDFGKLLAYWGPHQAQDYAKAIFWGCVAGFAERMVPNLLNSFAAKADAADDDSQPDRNKVSDKDETSPETSNKGRAVDDRAPSAPAMASRGLANQD